MAITGEYYLYQQGPYNFGSLTAQGGVKPQRTEGFHQASAWQNQGVPNTTPQVLGMPSIADMEMADKIASTGVSSVSNPFAVSATKASEESYFARPQNESRELENSDISGSHLGAKLDLQGCENKAWGKKLEWE